MLGIGIAYTFKGLRYLVLKPTLAQLRWSDLLGLSPRGVGFAFTVGGFLVAVLGGALFRVARALGRADTRRLLAVDHRPPVLYLRSFDDDTLPLATIASARRPFFELLSFRGRDPFEEAVAWELATYGPVVAVGRPGRSLASLGAAREHLSDDTWKAQVAGRMHDARAIALAAGETPGLHWEVAQVVAAGHLAKTVFILPPLPADALARRWTFTSAALESAGAVGRPAARGRRSRAHRAGRRRWTRGRHDRAPAGRGVVPHRGRSGHGPRPGPAAAAPGCAAPSPLRRRSPTAPSPRRGCVAVVAGAPSRRRARRRSQPARRRRRRPLGLTRLRPPGRAAGTARPRGWPGPGARWACIGAVTKMTGRSRKAARTAARPVRQPSSSTWAYSARTPVT